MEESFDVPVKLKHTIYHGPLAFTSNGVKLVSNYVETTVDFTELDDEAKETMAKIFGDKAPLMITTSAGFNGEAEIGMEVAAFKFEDNESETGPNSIEFGGASGTLSGGETWAAGHLDIGGASTTERRWCGSMAARSWLASRKWSTT